MFALVKGMKQMPALARPEGTGCFCIPPSLAAMPSQAGPSLIGCQAHAPNSSFHRRPSPALSPSFPELVAMVTPEGAGVGNKTPMALAMVPPPPLMSVQHGGVCQVAGDFTLQPSIPPTTAQLVNNPSCTPALTWPLSCRQ